MQHFGAPNPSSPLRYRQNVCKRSVGADPASYSVPNLKGSICESVPPPNKKYDNFGEYRNYRFTPPNKQPSHWAPISPNIFLFHFPQNLKYEFRWSNFPIACSTPKTLPPAYHNPDNPNKETIKKWRQINFAAITIGCKYLMKTIKVSNTDHHSSIKKILVNRYTSGIWLTSRYKPMALYQRHIAPNKTGGTTVRN
jgi:hypothetical protein